MLLLRVLEMIWAPAHGCKGYEGIRCGVPGLQAASAPARSALSGTGQSAGCNCCQNPTGLYYEAPGHAKASLEYLVCPGPRQAYGTHLQAALHCI